MLTDLFNNPIGFFLWIIGLLVAITVHEYSHAAVADRLGDPTARLMGRVTLNPLAHLDVLGTIMLLLASFGWGKPVPVDTFNLRHPRRDSAFISFAGPLSNLVLASLCSFFLRLVLAFGSSGLGVTLAFAILSPIVIMNVSLAIFNLIPIYPFDGFAIVRGFLPEEAAKQWQQLESLGYIMILILVFPLFGQSIVLSIIEPVIRFLINILLPV